MWSNHKMKFVASIHNDDMKCFHVAIQDTHKLVIMGHINFGNHVLIKRCGQVKNECDKWDVQGQKNQNNHQK
jgi:hypothetical protein